MGSAINKILRLNIFFASHFIAKVGHDDAAQRTRQVARCKNGERLELAEPFRNIAGEENLADHGSEKDENNEVVKFQRATQRRECQRFVILGFQARCLKCGHKRPEKVKTVVKIRLLYRQFITTPASL
ncbi:hypothetical protein BN1183_AH_00790 [Pantoea ananatis]|nr:hypothetical protein BN1183_AH_00790 [Pantoea ananatis]